MKPTTALTIITVAGTLAGGIVVNQLTDKAPEPQRKIVLHGVDCALDDGEICEDARPVLEEAARLIAEAKLEADPRIEVVVQSTDEAGFREVDEEVVQSLRNYLVLQSRFHAGPDDPRHPKLHIRAAG